MEITERSQGETLETIYFGGGTPSLLSTEQLKQILDCLKNSFQIANNCEITLETNPGTVTKEKLKAMKELGINRLSLGVQTFDPALIAKLARGHNVEDAIESLGWAFEAGFANISLDLIYGLPKQSIESWKETIDQALKQPIQHISCYSLAIEEGTPFKKIYVSSSNELLPQETELATMYETLQTKLTEKGFKQYEVSNFAKPGFESRHNKAYWENKEFYGFGVSAHEFIAGKRRAHSRSLEAYLNNPLEQEELDCNPQIEELMLALRTAEGLDLVKYQSKFETVLYKTYKEFIDKCIQENLLTLENNYLKLTPKGFLLSNEIIARLI